jgi:hypothetical protein
MKKIIFLWCLLLSIVCTSCSDSDYVNCIPAESSLLLSMDPVEMTGTGSKTVLKTLLHVSDLGKAGIDFTSKIYLFEDGQGNLGFCAKMSDADKLADVLESRKLKISSRQDNRYVLLPNNWLMGWNDCSLMIMGPILPAAQSEMMSLMQRYFKQDDEEGIQASPMFAKLDSIGGAMSLVCQVSALPQQIVAPLTLGAPANTEPSQVWLAAQLKTSDGIFWMNGQTFSFNRKINDAIRKSDKVFRPIHGDYIQSMSSTDVIGLFLNVDGRDFIKLIQQNRGVQAMLTAINAAIDMDNIIRGIDGDLYIVTPSIDENKFQLQMAAKMQRLDWLADVDYWKQSVPKGGRIGDWGRDCYYYTSDKTTYYFGVNASKEYMSGSNEQKALASVHPASTPLSSELTNKIKGQHMAMVINMSAFSGDKAEAVTSMLRPLFGNVNTILYTR